MKNLNKIILIFFFHSCVVYAQSSIQWQKSFGGSGSDVAYAIEQTTDSGYIVAGYSESNDSDVTGYHGNRDFWIVKSDHTGILQWQKALGGTDIDLPNFIQQTNDGGFIVAGYSISNDGDITGNHGQEDFWIVKLNSLGNKQWQKSLGGSNVDKAYSIQQTSGGGFIVAGSSTSIDGDITFHHGTINVQNDCWVVYLDSIGTILWEKSLGGGGTDVAQSVRQTTDGGFIVAGSTSSDDGDVTGLHSTGIADYWIVKLNSTGTIEWQKTLGGTRDEFASTIQQTSDGGYIIAGNSTSSDGDVSFHYGSFVSNDIWIVKTDSAGMLIWEKTFGGTDIDMVNSIRQTDDGGFIIAGYTNSNDGDLTGLNGLSLDYDYWIIKLDNSGVIQWQKILGGTDNDIARNIIQTNDDGYIIAGSSRSNNGDVTGNNGNSDYWIVKLSSTISVSEVQNSPINFQVSPNPFSGLTFISFQFSASENIKIEIRDIEGRIVMNPDTKNLSKNTNSIIWDATNNAGIKVDDGIYFITIISGDIRETKKVILLKK